MYITEFQKEIKVISNMQDCILKLTDNAYRL